MFGHVRQLGLQLIDGFDNAHEFPRFLPEMAYLVQIPRPSVRPGILRDERRGGSWILA